MIRSDFKYFSIFGAMRTGSNLLERTLMQFEDFSCHGELFNPAFIGKPGRDEFLGISREDREANPKRIVKKMVNQSGNTLPGFRIFQGHDPRIMKRCVEDPECAKIILKRRPIDSFVSLKIAQQTDQWMLGNASMRKSAVIDFDADEFRSYLASLDAYHAELELGLQTTGQAAFHISYSDLKSPDVINGLAAYLGTDETLTSFTEKIKRQNPQALEEKVSNHAEMIDALGTMGLDSMDAVDAPESRRALSVRDFVTCTSAPFLYVPLPGVEAHEVLDWMARVDGVDAGSLTTGLNQKKLGHWLADAQGLTAMAVVEHPLERAFRVFRRHIFTGGDHIYPQIQSRLVEHFGLVLPEAETGDDAVLGTAFEAFMAFLKANLAGQTSIRIDQNWEAQHKLLSGVQPLTRVVRRRDFPDVARSLSDIDVERAASADGLNRIYSRRLENLARAAYAKDYAFYGFSDWEP